MKARFVYDTERKTRPAPPPPLIPLAEMVRRIEAVRMADIRATRDQKRCPACGEPRLLRAFSRNRSAYDGLCGRCKICERARKKLQRSRLALQASAGAAS